MMVFEKVTSNDFTWENNVALVCYSLGVTGSGPKVSGLWDVDTELLARFVRGSPMFPDVKEKAITSVIQQLRRFFGAPG